MCSVHGHPFTRSTLLPLPPPSPTSTTPKMWGGSMPKGHWGIHSLDKTMILQGVKQTIQPVEVGYANSPKKAQKGGMRCFPLYAWLSSNNLCKVILARKLFSPKNFPPHVMCNHNDHRDNGIILSHIILGSTPPNPPPPPHCSAGRARPPRTPPPGTAAKGGGWAWANGLPCHCPPRSAIFFPPCT